MIVLSFSFNSLHCRLGAIVLLALSVLCLTIDIVASACVSVVPWLLASFGNSRCVVKGEGSRSEVTTELKLKIRSGVRSEVQVKLTRSCQAKFKSSSSDTQAKFK